MKDTKHTPGPWRLQSSLERSVLIQSDAVPVHPETPEAHREYYSSIASVTQRDPNPGYGGGISQATCEANARLIALAPDLLGVCQRLASWSANPEHITPTIAEELIRQAQNAIARATGNQ